MAILKGNLFLLQINTGLSYRDIAGVTTNGFEVTADMIDITTKDSNGWAQFIPGRLSSTLSLNMLYDPEVAATSVDILDLFDAWKNGTSLSLYLGQMTVGERFYSMSGYLSSISVDANQNDVTSVSCTFQVSGAIASGVYNP